jgi:hypothetical protein
LSLSCKRLATRQLANSPNIFLLFVILTGRAPTRSVGRRLGESGFSLPARSIREGTAGQILRSETNADHCCAAVPALTYRYQFLRSLTLTARQRLIKNPWAPTVLKTLVPYGEPAELAA